MADVYRAKEPFAYTDKKGVPRNVGTGDLMFSDDPNFKGKEKLFEPVEVAAARVARVEEATAEPGQLRSVSTPRRGGRKAADHPPTVTPQSEKAPEQKKGDES